MRGHGPNAYAYCLGVGSTEVSVPELQVRHVGPGKRDLKLCHTHMMHSARR